ncbi:Methanogenesis regulatory protein FilR1 [Methanogenium sp. MK-MG]|nr:Methanogenesis regulatory protein FilR1 [Methanogenium sp. MK-MG]
MDTLDTLEIFNTYQDGIQKLFRSRLLLQIMISLDDGNKTLAELRGVTDTTSQTILPKIRFLEEVHYIRYDDDAYHLTPQGNVISSQIQDHVRTAYLFSKNPKFWSSHYLEALPAMFLRDIGDLYHSGIVETLNTNIFSVLECFFDMLENAEQIRVVSSFMSHLHADALIAKVKEGVPVEMVVNTEIAEELRKEPFLSKIEEIAGYNHFRIYVAPTPLLIGLTVTDSTLSFGLCRNDDLRYDISSDLIGTDNLALAWGERLFSYYKDISEELSSDPSLCSGLTSPESRQGSFIFIG